MSIFNDSVYLADSSSMQLFDEAPDLIGTAVFEAIYKERSIVDNILYYITTGMGINLETYYNYGYNKYALGLPNGMLSYNTVSDATIAAIISQEIGETAKVATSILDTGCETNHIMNFLKTKRGYSEYDSTVTSCGHTVSSYKDSRWNVYRTDNKLYYVSAESTKNNYITITYSYHVEYEAFTKKWVNESNDPDMYKWKWSWETVTGLFYETETVYFSDFNKDDMYYYVEYYTISSDGVTNAESNYWTYNLSDNTYDVLSTNEAKELKSAYYPVVPIRKERVDLTSSTYANTSLFKTSKALLDKVGIDLQVIGDSLNESKDVDKIRSAYIIPGVWLQTKSQAGIVYLHNFFKYLAGFSKLTEQDYDRWNAGIRNSAPSLNTVSISDGGYQMMLKYAYIKTGIKTGVIGAIGYATRTNYIVPGRHYTKYYRKKNQQGRWDRAQKEVYLEDRSYIIFKKQLSATQYSIVHVQAPVHINKIKGDYFAQAYYSQSKGEYITDFLSDTDVIDSNVSGSLSDKENFIIPLDTHVLHEQSVIDRTAIAYDAFRIVINVQYVEELKWYQSSLFMCISLIIAAVCMVIPGLQGAGGAIGTAFAEGGYMAAAMVILTKIITTLAIQMVTDWAAEQWGVEIVIILATVFVTINMISPKNTFISGSIAGTPFAVDFMTIGISFANSATDYYEQQVSDTEEETALLEEANIAVLEEWAEELDSGFNLNPMVLTEESTETVSAYIEVNDYIDTAIHTGNIGVLSLDTIGVYTTTMLNLDKDFMSA